MTRNQRETRFLFRCVIVYLFNAFLFICFNQGYEIPTPLLSFLICYLHTRLEHSGKWSINLKEVTRYSKAMPSAFFFPVENADDQRRHLTAHPQKRFPLLSLYLILRVALVAEKKKKVSVKWLCSVHPFFVIKHGTVHFLVICLNLRTFLLLSNPRLLCTYEKKKTFLLPLTSSSKQK